MSVWSDIHKRSNGFKKKKEDTISNSQNPLVDVERITFVGKVDNPSQLPSCHKSEIGQMYYVSGSKHYVIFDGKGWQIISELTEEVDNPNNTHSLTIKTSDNNEINIREYTYQGSQDF